MTLTRRSEDAQSIPIVTFVNDEALYAEMVESFATAGFSQFTALREGEPHSTITRLGRDPTSAFVVLCHQDVRCDQGHDHDMLASILAGLTTRDPRWAVAGNAGQTPDGRALRYLTDPHGSDRDVSAPELVVALDENFLVLHTSRRPHCSTSLSGFHLYGADVCLNGERDGSHAYIIPFAVSHLSGGNTRAFAESAGAFNREWNNTFHARYYRAGDLFFLSRWRLLRSTLGHPHVIWRLNERHRALSGKP